MSDSEEKKVLVTTKFRFSVDGQVMLFTPGQICTGAAAEFALDQGFGEPAKAEPTRKKPVEKAAKQPDNKAQFVTENKS